MAETSYYVYALKYPRTSPAKPFYIGKGTGTRAHDHLARPDDTPKGARIREIVASGKDVLVSHLVCRPSSAARLTRSAGSSRTSPYWPATGGPVGRRRQTRGR